MTERVAIRPRFPRIELQSSDDVHSDMRLWGNERTRKHRRSADAKFGGKFDTYGGGGSTSQDSSDSLKSDIDPGGVEHEKKGGSNSDSDHQTWTKNPLMVRKVKRTNKSYQTEKRWSGVGVGVAAGNKDAGLYHSSEGGASETHSLGRNTNSNASGSSSKGSSKYQRLEEMRRKRINLSVTSDEESTAQTAKTPLRYGTHVRNFPGAISRVEPSRQTEGLKSHSAAGKVPKIDLPAVLDAQPSILPTRSLPTTSQPNNSTVRSQLNIVPAVSPLSPARVGFGSLLLTSEYAGQIAPPTLVNQHTPAGYTRIHTTEPLKPFYRQPDVIGSPQPDVTGTRQPFYKIVDIKPPSPTPALNSTPTQFTIHKFTTQLPVYSTNSAIDSRLKPHGASLQNVHCIKPSESPSPAQGSQAPTLNTPSQQPKAALKMPVRTAKQAPQKSSNNSSQTGLVSLRRYGQSDDSLDELVESNIRYLDRASDKSTPKKNPSTHVMRLVNQADPRNVSLAGFSAGRHNQPSVQVRTSTNIELHVSVPAGPYPASAGTAVSHLQIEPASGFDDQGISPPDVVPRKMIRDNSWRPIRSNNEQYDRVIMTQSDHSDQFADTRGLQLDKGHARGRFDDGKTRSDSEVGRPARQIETGMFSDVEYDIEVSERVKKWETLLKVRDSKLGRNTDCDTILENAEGESTVLSSESEPRKAALSWQQFQSGSPYFSEVARGSSTVPTESDKSLIKSENWTSTNMAPVETNTGRRFQTLTDPARNVQSQIVSKVFQPSGLARVETLDTSNDQPRHQVLTNQAQSFPVTNTFAGARNRSPLSGTYEHQTQSQTETPRVTRLPRNEGQDTSPRTRPSKLTNVRDLTKRGSVYKEELDEISGLKADTVVNLRRHFDTGSTTVTSDDDQRSVSTASAKLTRPPSEHRVRSEPMDWSKMLPGYKAMIKDSDLWSPNLESTHGVPVSIERVTARTLQTIPFSEDPFWKEMEEMTSFNPSESVGQPRVGFSHERAQTVDHARSHHRPEVIPPQSLTLPMQSRDHVTPIMDRIQKPKPLYTPNIAPFSVDASRKIKSDAVSALDAVLKDINSSAQDRMHKSYGDKPLEEENTRTVSALARVSSDLHNHPRTVQPNATFKNGHAPLRTPGASLHSVKPLISTRLDHVVSDEGMSKSTQSHHQPQRQFGKLQISQGSLSGYQLDPHLLKQKLLKTGLVEADTEEPAERGQYRRSWPRSSVPPGNIIAASTTTPSYTKPTTQSTYSFPSATTTIPSYTKPTTQSTYSFPSATTTPSYTKPTAQSTYSFPSATTTTPSYTKPTTQSTYSFPSATTTTPSYTKPTTQSTYSFPSATTTPSYTKPTAQSNYSFPTQESVPPTSAQASSMPGTVAVGTTGSYSGKQAGLHTLDNLQNALTPFRSTSYQPGPESLYGSSRLEFFMEPALNQPAETQSSTRDWASHKQMNIEPETADCKENSSSSSSSRLQEVNQSMDDLKNLALDVEQKIGVIKSRLQSANENSLDSILSSLRTLAPQVKRHEAEPATFEDYYATKKSKLSDALTELDRIYSNLGLNEQEIGLSGKGGNKRFGQQGPNYPVVSSQPKSVHLRPMQTRISSVFLRGPDSTKKESTDKEKESQIDVISKSFEDIVDEVNKTTKLLSRVGEENRQENMAPETQKQTFKMMVKPGSIKGTTPLPYPTTDAVLATSTPSVAAPSTQAEDFVDNKLKSKLEDSLRDGTVLDNPVAELGSAPVSSTDHALQKTQRSVAGTGQVPEKKIASTVTVTASAVTKQASSDQAKARPVQDNKIIQEDRAAKQQSSEKTFWMSSPTMSRKVIGQGADAKLQPPQVLSETQTEESGRVQPLYKAEVDHVPITLQVAASASAPVESGVSDSSTSLHLQPAASATDLAPSTVITTLPAPSTPADLKPPPTGSKPNDKETVPDVDPKSKRRVGAGVGTILDKFSSDKGKVKVDSVKSIPRPRDAPDVNKSVTEATVTQDSTQLQTQPTVAGASDQSLGNNEQSLSNNVTKSPCEKSVVSFLVKKVGESETKAASQPSSQVNTTKTSAGKKQNVDVQAESPQLVADEPGTVSTGESTPSDGYLTPKEAGSTPEATERTSLPGKTTQTKPPNNRPHSFHELISCTETTASDAPAKDKFRKCASSGELSSDSLAKDVTELSD